MVMNSSERHHTPTSSTPPHCPPGLVYVFISVCPFIQSDVFFFFLRNLLYSGILVSSNCLVLGKDIAMG